MSEYIVDFGDEKSSAFVRLAMAQAEASGARLQEEIVRCRDCRYYDEIIHACERFDSIKQANVSYVFDDGFCVWGERRGE